MDDEIKIIDVIHHYNAYSMQVCIVLSRMPKFVYERKGRELTAHDSGIYDFMVEEPGTTRAFAGSEFDIALADGASLHCAGQVWSGRSSPAPETLIDAGISTIEELAKCHVFMGCGGVSKAKYEAWLSENRPSYNYSKYDERSSIAWLDRIQQKYPGSDRTVCAKRARKLRQRGITIRRHPETAALGWCPNYERRKADILRWLDPDYRGPHYNLARHGAARNQTNTKD